MSDIDFCDKIKQNRQIEPSSQLSARDQRMATTICIICLGYFFCNIPSIVILTFKIVPGNNLFNLIQCLNWLQFSFNFVVYAARNKQYREAYKLFLHDVLFCRKARRQNSSVRNSRATMRQISSKIA